MGKNYGNGVTSNSDCDIYFSDRYGFDRINNIIRKIISRSSHQLAKQMWDL